MDYFCANFPFFMLSIQNYGDPNSFQLWCVSLSVYLFASLFVCLFVCLYRYHLKMAGWNVYVYLKFKGASTSQVIGARNEWWWMIMMAKWYSGTLGPKLPDICLTGEEKPREKPHPGNLSRPGIEPGPAAWQARMLPLAPQRLDVAGWIWTKLGIRTVLLRNRL